jgi:polyphosphate kinase
MTRKSSASSRPDATAEALADTEHPEAPEAPAPTPTPEVDLSAPGLYLNREITWLEFNRRVLHEALDERTPLLERVKFVAIVSANLDEFFMKRIGGLKQQVGAGVQDLTPDGRTPQEQIAACYAVVRELEAQRDAVLPELLGRLEEHGIQVLGYDRLTDAERGYLRTYYLQNIFPLVTPQSVDPAHPFPFISNLSLNLLVTLRYAGDGDISLARVKVPVGGGIPRFLRLQEGLRFVALEDVMASNLDLLFPAMEVVAVEPFYVTRNANTERNEENAEDLMALIESELRDRKFASIVRIQVRTGMDPVRRGMLGAELALYGDDDVFETAGMLAGRHLFEIAGLDLPALHDRPHHPIDHPKLQSTRNLFHIIRENGSLLLQHPYESFTTSVERFLREASRDPKVRAIKMTLYRTSSRTKVIDYLIDAAENGKQVAVAVELKARFDEAANIRWASRMEEAGIHVTYGVVGLKTHCKVILVVRQDYNGLKRYVHIGTGNYNADTARIYADLGLLTCDEAIGQDATELFNYLTTGYTPDRHYQKLLPAPKLLKRTLLAKIERETELHRSGQAGHIQFKMNALEDVDIARALYRASQAGVQVDLIVRDTCRVRPGVPGLSETLRVISIVGRFLEHTRIYYFRNAGQEEYYIGSADCMKRNLEHRVEVVAPVEDPAHRETLRAMLNVQLGDPRSAWDLQPDASYVQRQPADPDAKGAQEQLIELAEKRHRDARAVRKRRSDALLRRAQRR